MNKKKSMRVAIALSGGMDSLFAMLLLLEAGYELMAVHGQFFPPTAQQEGLRAALQKQCDSYGVCLHCLDMTEAFHRLVIAPFVQEYIRGNTPNPCAGCNPAIKFGLLFDQACAQGAEAFATGHYAATRSHFAQGTDGALMRGADPVKDQSYFLSRVPAAVFERVLFPLGKWHKTAVRTELKRRGVAIPAPLASQEICFVPDGQYTTFLQNYGTQHKKVLPGPGPVRLVSDNRLIGQHKGLWRYTQGQRRGLGIAWECPLYVIDKDTAANTLFLGPKEALRAAGCVVEEVNFFLPRTHWPAAVVVQTRYRQGPVPARVEQTAQQTLLVEFMCPTTRPAPGQVAAVYDCSGHVLAGGIIRHILPCPESLP